ncbi:hypothetical protein ABIF41_004767 [Bradyrhizobium japonicum]|uniref:hypothetical protein n=1 Tax=Bradyrhizobium diazoefficiens TaxID=1355477 RepID=UPI0034811053
MMPVVKTTMSMFPAGSSAPIRLASAHRAQIGPQERDARHLLIAESLTDDQDIRALRRKLMAERATDAAGATDHRDIQSVEPEAFERRRSDILALVQFHAFHCRSAFRKH